MLAGVLALLGSARAALTPTDILAQMLIAAHLRAGVRSVYVRRFLSSTPVRGQLTA